MALSESFGRGSRGKDPNSIHKPEFDIEISADDFVGRLRDAILSYKREPHDWKSPYDFSYPLFSVTTVWPNKFKLDDKRKGVIELLFDISNSKKSAARLTFCLFVDKDRAGKERIVAFYQLKKASPDHSILQYTTMANGELVLVDTGTDMRFDDEEKDKFKPTLARCMRIKADLEFWLENYRKLLYKPYIHNSAQVTYAGFFAAMAANTGSTPPLRLNESFGRGSRSKKGTDAAAADFNVMLDFEEFDRSMRMFHGKYSPLFDDSERHGYPLEADGSGLLKRILYRYTMRAESGNAEIVCNVTASQNDIIEGFDPVGKIGVAISLYSGGQRLYYRGVKLGNDDFTFNDLGISPKDRNTTVGFLGSLQRFILSAKKAFDEMIVKSGAIAEIAAEAEGFSLRIKTDSGVLSPCSGDECSRLMDIIEDSGFLPRIYINFCEDDFVFENMSEKVGMEVFENPVELEALRV